MKIFIIFLSHLLLYFEKIINRFKNLKESKNWLNFYSILVTIIFVSGSIRFHGLSLIDEMSFLILLLLLIIYRYINPTLKTSGLNVNFYYKKANTSFNILFLYLIFSLIHGVYFNPYFGKIRWAIILISIMLVNKFLLFYLYEKLNDYSRIILLKKIQSYLLYFALFYIFYALFFKLFFGINPAYIQAAQIEAWYAIWGTTAYTAIIFLPLMLYSKVLFVNKIISLNKIFFIYVLLFSAGIFFDSRMILIVLLTYIATDIYQSKFKALFLLMILITIPIVVMNFSEVPFIEQLWSSGGFLWQLIFNDTSVRMWRDFDRVAHYIAAFNTINHSAFEMIFGTGFLNAGKSIIAEYFNVYNQYGRDAGVISSNMSGISKSTFGLSAFIIENGYLGLILFIMHIYNMCMLAIKTKIIAPSSYIVVTYFLLILIMFTIYINDNMAFYILLTPSIFIYPLMNNSK
jgi:hypothetical protein